MDNQSKATPNHSEACSMSACHSSCWHSLESYKKRNEALLEACRCAFDYSVPIEVRKDKVYQAISNAETNNK